MTVSSATPPMDAALSPMQQAILELRTLRVRLQASEGRVNAPVAITGMSCRFPGRADTLSAFWRLLDDGIDAIGEVPPNRWDIKRWYDPDPDAPGTMSTRYGGFLENIDRFDASFFNISDREAVSIDPQHRLLLEAGWDALDNAGLTTDTLFGSNTGVFVGISSFDYASLRGQTGDPAGVDAYHATGISHSAAAGRLAYYFGLQGPCLSIDTACSSSLVAIHLACQSLRLGECNVALAGGINLILSPEIHVTLSKARMLAPDGRCKAFDEAADGFVRSEGCGIVVVKLLEDALRDGDRIHAVILGSACNQDGRSSGLSAPNGPSQTAVVKAAWRAAGVQPEDVTYVEAHGTGTALGDPIEAGALAAALADTPMDHVMSLGTVKSNLGHMEAAAGVGGVIKTALAFRHETLPASLHFKTGSPNIEWSGSRLRVLADKVPWRRNAKPRIAGVSSFGFSGTNVHLVLQEPPSIAAPTETTSATRVLTLSAADEPSLRLLADQFSLALNAIGSDPHAWPDFTYTANTRRSHFAVRAAVVASSPSEAAADLAQFARASVVGALIYGRPDPMRPPAVALSSLGGLPFVRDPRKDALYTTSTTFRAAVDQCVPYIQSNAMRSDGASEAAQAFATQWALAQTWRSWIPAVSAVSGQGLGAYVAACVADVFTAEVAIQLIIQRAVYLEAARVEPEKSTAAFETFRQIVSDNVRSPSRLGASLQTPRRSLGEGLPAVDPWLNELRSAIQGSDMVMRFGDAGPQAIVIELASEAQSKKDALGSAPRADDVSLALPMLKTLSELYVRGAPINWRNVEGLRPGCAVELPHYPWARQRYWFDQPARSDSAASWSSMVAAVDRQADQMPIDLQLHTYPEKYKALDGLASAYIVRSLVDLKAFDQAGTSLTADAIVQLHGVLPVYRQLLDIWLNKLAREGLLLRTGASFTAVQPLSTAPVASLERDAEALFTDAPMLLDYVKGCGALLTSILRREVSPLETLFPGGDFALAEGLYHRAALSRYYNAIAACAARNFVEGRPNRLRILEVGAGTGGVTSSILAELPADRTSYIFSDVSEFFFEAAARRCNAYNFVEFAVLDLESPPQSQGFDLKAYDLIVAANVLHATKDLGQTLNFVHSLLAPGGALLLYEVTNPPSYFDVSIALIEGWQKASDNIRGIGPLLDTQRWKELLPKHGFSQVESWPSEKSPAQVLGSCVFMARANDVVASSGLVTVPEAVPRAFKKQQNTATDLVRTEESEDIDTILAQTPDSEHHQMLLHFVKRQVAKVLRRPEGSDIPRDKRLMDLGLDSLMAVELRNALSKRLKLTKSLPATLIFDHPSIADIASFLLDQRRSPEATDLGVPDRQEEAIAGHSLPSRMTAAELDTLSDADVIKLLNDKLERSEQGARRT